MRTHKRFLIILSLLSSTALAADTVPGNTPSVGTMQMGVGTDGRAYFLSAAAAKLPDGGVVSGPSNTTPYFVACADNPCISPDAGTDWACLETPLATVQIVSLTANVNYRSTLDPDGGFFASTSDNALGTHAGYRENLTSAQTITETDGGVFGLVIMHLSTVDTSASVAHCP